MYVYPFQILIYRVKSSVQFCKKSFHCIPQNGNLIPGMVSFACDNFKVISVGICFKTSLKNCNGLVIMEAMQIDSARH
ncbi:hypothetical protein CEXT_431101 [Caerostris extrusa]|uniref:Uncharacterized protein n=1 Tax=Caerostris extrusa TaxID=172846 RepID=A0AAV4TDR8_CAEEX|nr:hypothetical protein CEXT_431101 [Caerostris extrusa]